MIIDIHSGTLFSSSHIPVKIFGNFRSNSGVKDKLFSACKIPQTVSEKVDKAKKFSF